MNVHQRVSLSLSFLTVTSSSFSKRSGLPWKVTPRKTSVGLGNVQAVPLAPALKADPQAGRTIRAGGDSDLLTEMKRPDGSLFPWLSGQ